MTADSFIAGLDAPSLLGREAERLDRFFSSLPADGWTRPSRCDGWTARDVLAHLLATEDYHHACLDGDVASYMDHLGACGATDLDTANQLGIDRFAGVAPAELRERWRTADADTRRGFRERGNGTVDTSVGSYPARWQACHVASELATHADDLGVPIVADERAARCAWRAQVSRFALAEAKPDATITIETGGTRVRLGQVDIVVDDDELVEGVAARLADTSRLDGDARAAVSAMP